LDRQAGKFRVVSKISSLVRLRRGHRTTPLESFAPLFGPEALGQRRSMGAEFLPTPFALVR
jgi:hypothetical protein